MKLKAKREVSEEPQAPIVDKVKLGEPGYKDRYYAEKFDLSDPEEIDKIRKDTVLKYVEGLCWVCRYYYQGVCSWQWYYPYHYAPFASDLKDLADLEITFFPGEPFKPFDQLMGTLPAASSNALPEEYRRLMTDPSSPIHEFYPSDFEIDMNGKRFAWQGIAKLPFIDEMKLLAETKKLEHTLTEQERIRNSVMFDLMYVYPANPLAGQIVKFIHVCSQLPPHQRYPWPIDTNLSGGMNGYLWLCARNGWKNVVPSPVSGLQDIEYNQIFDVTYLNPPHHQHIPEPPKGVVMPGKVLKPFDIKPFPVLWHEDNGGRRRQGRERPQVPGAISGPLLGEAAHRLLRNTLNIKPNHTNSGLLEKNPYWNSPSNHVINKPRPAGPFGYERGFGEDQNYHYGNHNYHRGIVGNPRFPISPSELQGSKPNFKSPDKYLSQEQYRNLRSGMSGLTIEEGVRTRPHAVMSPRMPNSGQLVNMRHQLVQNIGPLPSPPPKWINKPTVGNGGMYIKQPETSAATTYEKQVKKVYQVKNRVTQNLSDTGYQQ